jgi:hypothetical protein
MRKAPPRVALNTSNRDWHGMSEGRGHHHGHDHNHHPQYESGPGF